MTIVCRPMCNEEIKGHEKDLQKDSRKFKIVKTRQEQDNNKIYGQHFGHTNQSTQTQKRTWLDIFSLWYLKIYERLVKLFQKVINEKFLAFIETMKHDGQSLYYVKMMHS